ncbi:amino acid transporter, partial [Staphylococcus aureus]|nr:amino acid transporter [Staphylococcus aureus]
GLEKILFCIATIMVSWLWFFLLAILGKVLGSIDRTGKYILFLNKISSIIIAVSIVIVKNILKLIL